MSDISVLDVQRHLRNQADTGHDIISNPGKATIEGENYRKTLLNAMILPNPEIERNPDSEDYYQNKDSGLSTYLPIGESGNVLEVNSLHRDYIGKGPSHYVMSPTLDTRFNPHRHTYNFHDSDWEGDKSLLDKSVKQHYDAAHKFPSYLSVLNPDNNSNLIFGKAYAKNRTREGAMSLSKHDPAEGLWNAGLRTMFGHRKVHNFYIPKPKELGLMDMGNFVIVGKAGTDQVHLYHPDTEQLHRIK